MAATPITASYKENKTMKKISLAIAALMVGGSAFAAPVHYTIDPNHTFPSFEVPHIQSISMWRGKLTKTSGNVVLDREAKSGSVDITIQANSFDFGMAKLDEHVESDEMFDAKKFPTITYKADSIKFTGDAPSEIDGNLTMHGVTKPVALKINSFKCIMHPMLKKEVCGADASAELNRSDFGIDYGVKMTGSPTVKLAIQVEALKD
jgi:polyisoprenoid-binding protein YceI